MRTALLLVATLAACRAPPYVGPAFSALPLVGFEVDAGLQLRESLALEAGGTLQFLDDTDFVDDGFAEPGDFVQLHAGLKHRFRGRQGRRRTLRYGLAWLRADGEPLIIDRSGRYLGLYAGGGFETDVGSWTVGPEFRVHCAWGLEGQGFEALPQIVWHFVRRF